VLIHYGWQSGVSIEEGCNKATITAQHQLHFV